MQSLHGYNGDTRQDCSLSDLKLCITFTLTSVQTHSKCADRCMTSLSAMLQLSPWLLLLFHGLMKALFKFVLTNNTETYTADISRVCEQVESCYIWLLDNSSCIKESLLFFQLQYFDCFILYSKSFRNE